jgi:uncharacterized protein YjbJ (UPF0337 family)
MWVMNWDGIAGTWRRFRGKFKERLGKLTGTDPLTIVRKREQFAEVLQHEYDAAKAQAEKRFGAGAAVLIPVPIPILPKDVSTDRR